MLELRQWLQTLGGLTLGGLIGLGIGTLVYLSLRAYLPGIDPRGVIGLFTMIGAGVQRMLTRAGGFLAFFAQLYELGKLTEHGIINRAKYQEIVDELVTRRHLHKPGSRESQSSSKDQHPGA